MLIFFLCYQRPCNNWRYRTLRNKLTGLSWPKALPVVLMHMRFRLRAGTGLSPYEILFVRPMSIGMGPDDSRSLPHLNVMMKCYVTVAIIVFYSIRHP